MGREIEIKLPLKDAEYDKIFSVISGAEKLTGVRICKHGDVPCPVEHILKTDFYFSRYETREESKSAGEPQVIRIRCEKYDKVPPKAFFCIKRKTIENGVEFNREDETFIEKPEVVRDLLLLSGYHQFFEKNKDNQKYIDDLNFDITNLKISVTSFDESNSSMDEILERIDLDITNNKNSIENKKELREKILELMQKEDK